MKLPVTFRALGASITIEEKKISALGQWDERTGSIALNPDQEEMGKFIILIHEAMHVVETMMLQNKSLKRRVNHDFISGAAYGLAAILVHAGAVEGFTAKDWKKWNKKKWKTDESPKKRRRS